MSELFGKKSIEERYENITYKATINIEAKLTDKGIKAVKKKIAEMSEGKRWNVTEVFVGFSVNGSHGVAEDLDNCKVYGVPFETLEIAVYTFNKSEKVVLETIKLKQKMLKERYVAEPFIRH